MKKLLLLIAATLLLNNVNAQWQAIGPYGGNITCLAANDSVVFAGTNSDGIFRSTNNGINWQAVNIGLPPNLTFNSMAIIGSKVYAGSIVGLYVSADNGNSWVAETNGIPFNIGVTCLIGNDTSVFVGTFLNGIFLSKDNGGTWKNVNSSQYVTSLILRDSFVYAAILGSIYYSVNGGTNWLPENNGLPSDDNIALAVMGNDIYAGVNRSGVYRYSDVTGEWQPLNTGLSGDIVALISNDSDLYAGTTSGLFYTTYNNSNYNWSLVSEIIYPNVQSLCANGSNIFFSYIYNGYPFSNGGIFISTDYGAAWKESTNGITNTTIYSLVVNKSQIIAGGYGVNISINDGISWNVRNDEISNFEINSIAVSDTNIFAGIHGTGIILSTDNGSTWNNVDNGFGYIGDRDNFQALTVFGPNIFVIRSGQIFISPNNGGQWAFPYPGLGNQNSYALATDGSSIFAAVADLTDVQGDTFSYGGIFLSTDTGNTWVALDSGLPPEISVISLAVSDSTVFAGTSGSGIFLSNDMGMSWTAMNNGFPVNSSVTSLAVLGSNIFAGTLEYGVYLSTNNGDNWMPFNSGLSNTQINCLLVNDSIIIAGSNGGGVWKRSIVDITGLQQIQSSSTDFNLYPNPTNNSFTIETNTTGQKLLQLYNLTGQLLLSQTISDNKTIIDASGLASGIYAVSLQGMDGVVTKKMVVAR